jgi:hypothetical protein
MARKDEIQNDTDQKGAISNQFIDSMTRRLRHWHWIKVKFDQAIKGGLYTFGPLGV